MNETEHLKLELKKALTLVREVRNTELNTEVTDALIEIRKEINGIFVNSDELMQKVIKEAEKYEFSLVSVEADELVFRRDIDDKDLMFVKAKDFEETIQRSIHLNNFNSIFIDLKVI